MTQKPRDTTNSKIQAPQSRGDPTAEASGTMRTVRSLRSLPKPCPPAFVRTGPGPRSARRALSEAPNCAPALPPSLHCACARVALSLVLCPRRRSLEGAVPSRQWGLKRCACAETAAPRFQGTQAALGTTEESDSRVLTGVEPRGARERGGSGSDDNDRP